MFELAVVDELVEANPDHCQAGDLPKQRDRDPAWRSQGTFTVDEVERLISDPAIPVERRVQYALKALAGMRHGEAAALTWRAIDYTAEPLARINVVRGYNSTTDKIKTTKTENGRAVPMHLTLAKILAAWRLSHWSRPYGRQPTLDDLVVPTRNLTPIETSDAGARVQGRPAGTRAARRGGRAPRPRAGTTCAAGTRRAVPSDAETELHRIQISRPGVTIKGATSDRNGSRFCLDDFEPQRPACVVTRRPGGRLISASAGRTPRTGQTCERADRAPRSRGGPR
jgi:integrase